MLMQLMHPTEVRDSNWHYSITLRKNMILLSSTRLDSYYLSMAENEENSGYYERPRKEKG